MNKIPKWIKNYLKDIERIDNIIYNKNDTIEINNESAKFFDDIVNREESEMLNGKFILEERIYKLDKNTMFNFINGHCMLKLATGRVMEFNKVTDIKEFMDFYSLKLKPYKEIINVLEFKEGKIYEDNNGKKYAIDEDKIVFVNNGNFKNCHKSYNYLINKDFTECEENEKFKPKDGEMYFVPDILTNSYNNFFRWNNSKWDNELFNRDIIRKTEEEAIELASKMLKCANIE